MLNAIAKPFGLLLMWLYEITSSYGLAVIIFALVVKLILLPFMMKSKKSTLRMSGLQAQIKELEKRHGANKMQYNQAVQQLYRDEKINPAGGCIWTLIPFPILIALYQAIRFPLTIMMGIEDSLLTAGGAIYEKLASLGFTTELNAAYEQIAQAQFITKHFSEFEGITDKLSAIDFTFLGIDLGAQPQWNMLWTTDWSDMATALPQLGLFLIPIVAAILTYFSSKVSMAMSGNAADSNPQMQSMKSMTLMMPIMTLWFAFIMPAALGLYWVVSTLFGIIQDLIMTKSYKKMIEEQNAERIARQKAREEELEAKRLETERLKFEGKTVLNPNTSKKKQQQLDRLGQAERAAEYERRVAEEKAEKEAAIRAMRGEPEPEKPAAKPGEESSVGTRRYARGRAYMADRFENQPEAAEEAAIETAEEAVIEETPVIEAAPEIKVSDKDAWESAKDDDPWNK